MLQDTLNGKSASFLVVMASQANVSAGAAMRNQDAQGWYVYNALKTQAETSQGSVRAFLDARGVGYRSYWVANMLLVTRGDRALVEDLASRADVGSIQTNREYRGTKTAGDRQLLAFRHIRISRRD